MIITSYTTELGHLVLTRKPAVFRVANGENDFIPPTATGSAPLILPRVTPRASTAAMVLDPTASAETIDPFKEREAIRVYTEQKNEYTQYRNAMIALRNCILKSVDDGYIKVLKDKVTWYAKVSPLALLTYLWTTYGKVTIVDLKANKERMKVPWNPPNPIESLFLQLEEGQSFAAEVNDTIDDYQLVRLGYNNIVATGQFTKFCAKWRKRPLVDKK